MISAEPQLRDLKRESTAFVPSAVKKRKATATQEIKARVNAAPRSPSAWPGGAGQGTGVEEVEGEPVGPSRPDLIGTLREAGIGIGDLPEKATQKKTDDYDDFLSEMSDILGGS